MKYLKNITCAAIAIAAISMFFTSAHTFGRISIFYFIFTLFILLPYAILWRLTYTEYSDNGSKANRISLLITSLLITVLSLVASLGSLYETEKSSTSDLVFAVIPVYSLIIIAVVYPLASWLIGLAKEKNKTS